MDGIIETRTELINQAEAEYVNSISYQDFNALFPRRDDDKSDDTTKRDYYNMINKYINAHRINKYEGITINYKFAKGKSKGRLFGNHSASGICLQRIHGPLRMFLTRGIYHDYDMKNAHPTILLNLCKKHKLPTKEQEFFVNNRDKMLLEAGVTKQQMLVKLNSDKCWFSKTKNQSLHLLCQEWTNVKLELYEKYKDRYTGNETNPISSLINHVLCDNERMLLNSATVGIEYDVNMFDGFMCKQEIDLATLPMDIVSWVEKPIESDVEIPADYEIPENDGDCYKIAKRNFEKNHAKIIQNAGFCRINEDGSIKQLTRPNLVTTYEHMNFLEIIEGKSKKKSFIDTWLKDETLKCYDCLGSYPVPSKCPCDVLNTWVPFACEKLKDYTYDSDVVLLFKNHIKILCDHQTEVYEFFIKWLAHLFQYPDQKSIMPTIVSKEGVGKGILIDILTALMGSEKVLETTDPLRDVFGHFNGQMAGAYLVHLSEVSKVEMNKCQGKFKALITDPRININEKGQPTYTMVSHHKWIAASNGEDPIPSKKGDRRNCIWQASSEKKGDTDYFKPLIKIQHDHNSLFSIHQYLMSVPDVPVRFTETDIPITNYHEAIQEASRPYIEVWLEDFVTLNQHKNEVLLTTIDVLHNYKSWCKKNNVQEVFEMNTRTMAKKLSLMNTEGVKARKVQQQRGWGFDIQTLIDTLKININTSDGYCSDNSIDSAISGI